MTTTAAAKVTANVALFPAITVVGTRALEADQAWFQGEGRGYVREFIVREGQRYCEACNTTHDLTAFPTFSVPRANGETRVRVCRASRRAAKVAPKVTSVRVAQWTAEGAAKAMRVARAKKAAAASAKVRAAKAAARKASA